MISEVCTVENEQLLYPLALTRIKGIGVVQTKKLMAYFGDAAEVFRAPLAGLLAAGLPVRAAEEILAFDEDRHNHERVAAELEMLRQRSIRPVFFTDAAYPQRLSGLSDAPPLLYYQGNADLNAKRIVAIVGTRSPDGYGEHITAELIGKLASLGVLVISGLALGVDTAAHNAALENNLSTVGILGQGLATRIYPWKNAKLAEKMVVQGGLLSSFPADEKPARYNFPARNQVVAGLCDALVVVQTKRDGGSMLTAAHAKRYGRKIFAVPGRPTDILSEGCNWLIQRGDAQLLSSGEQLAAAMGWAWPEGGAGVQVPLAFASGPVSDVGLGTAMDGCGGDDGRMEVRLLEIIAERDGAGIDELAVYSGLDASVVALVLLRLELRGSVIALPGKRYILTPVLTPCLGEE